MLKVLAAVLAVLSAAISITIYTATLPDVQKQAADNAAAIEQNAEAIETLENKKLYLHDIHLTDFNLGSSTYNVHLAIYNDNSSPFTFNDLLNLAPTWRLPCTGSFTVSGTKYQAISIGKVSSGTTNLSLVTFPEIAPFQISSDKTLTDTIIEL